MTAEWHEYETAHSIRQERMQEAETWRLAQLAQSTRPHDHTPIYAPALAWLGGRLVEWGAQLQEQYEQYGELKQKTAQAMLPPHAEPGA